MKIVIVFCSHHFQFEKSALTRNRYPKFAEKIDRFRMYIETAVKVHQIQVIAEESHQEIEVIRGKSIARDIAEKSHGKYVYLPCEQSKQERKDAGIPSDDEIVDQSRGENGEPDQDRCDEIRKRTFSKRERYWIEKLKSQSNIKKILFLCGADHFPTFAAELIAAGIEFEINCIDWEACDQLLHGSLPLKDVPI